ncbi:hypothetical protein KY290_016376 [Solanum tuberosum]|uniref:Tail specific protease domain-containing protein n=1 Tax=Solanum tuberosum TaxID=4113 RepID=A0ABQ7V977_SOLTU|nr:hypothetical protein KY290_016376 [Solanum tuberosum]
MCDVGNVTVVCCVISVNEASASASEILARALHDNGRAILVGHKTFGKGNIQSVTQLHDGSALFVTVAKYLSPALHEIDQVGITPDVQLSGQEKFRTLTSSYFKCAHGIILEMVLFIGR